MKFWSLFGLQRANNSEEIIPLHSITNTTRMHNIILWRWSEVSSMSSAESHNAHFASHASQSLSRSAIQNAQQALQRTWLESGARRQSWQLTFVQLDPTIWLPVPYWCRCGLITEHRSRHPNLKFSELATMHKSALPRRANVPESNASTFSALSNIRIISYICDGIQ